MNDEVYLDAEMKAWEQASDNDYGKFLRDEQQLVFGIPYPLTLETLLDAHAATYTYIAAALGKVVDPELFWRRDHQEAAIRARISPVRATEGDSSSSFWWRRWIEHSRSPI